MGVLLEKHGVVRNHGWPGSFNTTWSIGDRDLRSGKWGKATWQFGYGELRILAESYAEFGYGELKIRVKNITIRNSIWPLNTEPRLRKVHTLEHPKCAFGHNNNMRYNNWYKQIIHIYYSIIYDILISFQSSFPVFLFEKNPSIARRCQARDWGALELKPVASWKQQHFGMAWN